MKKQNGFIHATVLFMIFFATVVFISGIYFAVKNDQRRLSIYEDRNGELVTSSHAIGRYTNRTDGVLHFGENEIALRKTDHSLIGTDDLIIKRLKKDPGFMSYDNSGLYLCRPGRCYKIAHLSDQLAQTVGKP